jgi:hypothetical protein
VVTAAAAANSKQKTTAAAQPFNLVAYLTLVPFGTVSGFQFSVKPTCLCQKLETEN